MEKIFARREFRKELENGDVLIATAEIHSLGQAPYFSTTGELYDRDYIRGENYTINSKKEEKIRRQ